MAKREEQPAVVTKKHLARAERERRQTRWIMGGTIIACIAALGIIGYGWLKDAVLAPREPVVTVNGVSIPKAEFRARVAWIMPSGSDVTNYGSSILSRLIDDVLIEEEAERRGLTVTDAEVEEGLRGFFYYFPSGTPTAQPSSTPDPTAQAAYTPTALPTPGPAPTATSTLEPQPTPTIFTEQAFRDVVQEYIEANGINESILRQELRSGLYRARLTEAFEAETPREAEQVHARHILVSTEEEAQSILDRLAVGEAWATLAAELSLDESNKDTGGELGWLARGATVQEFEDAAFSAPVGEPIGPVQTSFGWHVIWVVGREVRPLDGYDFRLAVQDALETWLAAAREEATITTAEDWQAWLPKSEGS
jgi:peptidyl-prolyl cis-trans isomerase D